MTIKLNVTKYTLETLITEFSLNLLFLPISDDVAFSGVQAVDADNDQLTYTITSEYFIINPNTGVITVARSLIDAPGETRFVECCVLSYKRSVLYIILYMFVTSVERMVWI